MRTSLFGRTFPALLAVLCGAGPAAAWDRGQTTTFAVLPNLPGNTPVAVEGLTVGPDGTVYTPTFGVNAKARSPGRRTCSRSNRTACFATMWRWSTRRRAGAAAEHHLLGLVFQASSKTLLICDLTKGSSGRPIRRPAGRACL